MLAKGGFILRARHSCRGLIIEWEGKEGREGRPAGEAEAFPWDVLKRLRACKEGGGAENSWENKKKKGTKDAG